MSHQKSPAAPESDAKFISVCNRLTQIDLKGQAGPVMPVNPTDWVQQGEPLLPLVYQNAYAGPLLRRLPSLLQQTKAGRLDPATLETLTAAVYDHIPGQDVDAPLQRFLAVISNLYRSFLSDEKRAAVSAPLITQRPPLAMFQHDGGGGPFTIPDDEVERLLGVHIGVVSLPATYRDDPLLWAALAHETGGHDVTHADPGLLDELAQNLRAFFGGGMIRSVDNLTLAQQQALLWSWWTDEASADVYGLLNIGPAFALNLAFFFAALNKAFGNAPIPTLRSASGPNPNDNNLIDPHPTDLIRLHLAIGVIDSLAHLAADTRKRYIDLLEQTAKLCAQGATTIRLIGFVPFDATTTVRLNLSVPLADMQDAARRAGSFIAMAKLNALGGNSIQDIETWNDADESTAQRIFDALKLKTPIVGLGDDAQLLAGATLAVLDDPDAYDSITQALSDALDDSFRRDPIWGTPKQDHAFQMLTCNGIRTIIEDVLQQQVPLNYVSGLTTIAVTQLNDDEPLRARCYGAIQAGLKQFGADFKNIGESDLALDPKKTVNDLAGIICDDVGV